MAEYARFSISTPSRHPANQNGYDSDDHRYRADYVKPASWILNLAFLPPGFAESESGKVTLPNDIVSYRWIVGQIGGSFRRVISKTRSGFRPFLDVAVPAPGDYLITLEVTVAGEEAPHISTRRYLLRDLLVVGIGDSFASGQGNPDVPAVPAPDQVLACEATTIALAVDRFKTFLNQLKRELAGKGEEIANYLPFAGKLAAATLVGANDVLAYVKNGVDDLKDWAVGVGRDVEATVVEGAEEVLGLFGIGDGGEFDDSDPRPPAWQEPYAYRSYRSGQSLAAAEIETETAFGADRVTFLAFGRTGSEIDSGLLGPRTSENLLDDENVAIDGWTENRGQIEEARDTVRGRRIDALVVTVGINDLGFSSLVSNSILKASGGKRRDRINGASNKVDVVYPARLDALKDAIDRELNPRHVFITEYPIGIFKEIAEGAPPCGVLGSGVPSPGSITGFDLDGPDARDLTALGVRLNATIRAKAMQFGWVLVDGIESGFDKHGYCASDSYFVSATQSCLKQGDFEGMLHPNRRGHAVTRDCIASALRRELHAVHDRWLEPVLHVLLS